MDAGSGQIAAIHGAAVHTLMPNADARGTLTEIYRESWNLGCRAVQVNAVTSEANVLRGVHVHVRHTDHFVLVSGTIVLGLHDLRPWSPTAGGATMIRCDGAHPQAVIIPTGVAHGFYSAAPTFLIYGASDYFDPLDEIGCRFDAPELGLAWPTATPALSERDGTAHGYDDFRAAFLARWRQVHGPIPDC